MSLRYLARQDIALQGSPENDNFRQLLILVGHKDPDILTTLNQSRFKYTHHDVQNEILDIMAQHVLREKLDQIRTNHYFAMMVDEYTDIANKGQMPFCVRSVNDDQNVEEKLSWVL